MLPFFSAHYTTLQLELQSAVQSLALTIAPAGKGYPVEDAMREASAAIDSVEHAAGVLPINKWLEDSRRIERLRARLSLGDRRALATSLQELAVDLAFEMTRYAAFLIPPERIEDFDKPLKRFGIAADKFRGAQDSMTAAGRCFALDQWEACVFHCMGVLEHGLRWFAGQFKLTLKKPVELENWENIIGNIEARVREFEKAANSNKRNMSPAELVESDKTLTFYSRASQEFRYFKNAWRNHVMHEHEVVYDFGTSKSVIDHVESFMLILAERA